MPNSTRTTIVRTGWLFGSLAVGNDFGVVILCSRVSGHVTGQLIGHEICHEIGRLGCAVASLRFEVVSSKYDGWFMVTYPIRVFGDPVLKRPTSDVTEVNGKFVKLVNAMLDTMYEAPGIGLAAPQVGVEQRFFVYDIGDGPEVLINPLVVATEGEWLYEEGCLSIPGLAFEIVRPKLVTVQATDLDGDEVVIEADELLGRCFLHEIDHLDGVLMFDRMERDTRKLAMREWRERSTPIADARHAL